MSQVNNRGVVNKRLRISSTSAFRQHENQSSSSSTNVAQSQSNSPGLSVDNETELSSNSIKEQFDSVNDIITQPIIEVPTKRLLHLKELGGNLFVSSSTKIYSKTLQKLIDRVLFTKSLNNDVNTASSDAHVFERVLARSDDNDAFSTCTSLAPPTSAIILVLGSTACEHALVWKLSQRRNFKVYCSPANGGIELDQPSAVISRDFPTDRDMFDFVDAKQIELVISLNKSVDYGELEGRLRERGVHYLGCSGDTLALSADLLNAKQFMTKHNIPTLEWTHCSTLVEGENFLNQHPDQQQWIIRAADGPGTVHCQTREETFQTLKMAIQEHLFGKNNSSVIIELGYSFDDSHLCTLYIVSDDDGDYMQLPIIGSESRRLGAYGPCPYLTTKQLSFIRRRIVERTLRCSTAIRHLFGFHLLIQGTEPNDIKLLGYKSTLEEPEGEVLLSLCEPEVILQYALDLPSAPILPSTSKKRRVHYVNTTIISMKDSPTIPLKVISAATKNNKVKIFHNQTYVNSGREADSATASEERIVNVLGCGPTLQEAQMQSVLACEYIKQHAGIDGLSFRTDIGSEAIEWYKTHGDAHTSRTAGLTNGKKKKLKRKTSLSTTPNKLNYSASSQRQNGKEIGDESEETTDDDDDDDNEPMDFERAFGTTSDGFKLEHKDISQSNGSINGSSIFEGESYFDLSTKVDLQAYRQPVLVSSTISLNPLAALFNLNDGDMNDSQTVFEYLGHELAVRSANDLMCARTLYVQCCSLPITSSNRSLQRFHQGIEQACQQLDCTFLRSTSSKSSSSSFDALCTGVCNREFFTLNNETNQIGISEGDLLIGLRCSSGTINTHGYVQLKELFQKKNLRLNDVLPFRSSNGEEESFFSLLLEKSSVLTPNLVTSIHELVCNRTIKVIRYLKDAGLARTIESLLGPLTGTLSAQLNGQQWPSMPPIFTWIYQHSGFSQDEMFQHFNCGVDYLLIVDHNKASVDTLLRQLTQTHTTCFLLGTLTATNATPTRNKPVRVPQLSRTRTVQLQNIAFKYPKPQLPTNNQNLGAVKDRMKQPIANDKTRCAVLTSTNDTSLLALLAYSTSTIDCAFEIVLVLSTVASLSDIARINELYPSVVTKVIQPKKYAARNYDLDQKIDDELQLHGCELVVLDRYACRLSPSFIQAWRGRLLNIYPSLLPSFRHSTSPIRDALQAGVRITGVTVHFIAESETDTDGPIIAQESIHITPVENETQLETRLHTLEQQVYPKAIDMVASGKIVYQGKKRFGKASMAPIIASSAY